MSEDPIQTLKDAIARSDDKDPVLADLVKPVRRVVDICETGDRTAKLLLLPNRQSAPTPVRIPIMKTTSFTTPGTAIAADFLEHMEESKRKLAASLPQFADVFQKLNNLETKREKSEKAIAAWLRGMAAVADIPESAATSATLEAIGMLTSRIQEYSNRCRVVCDTFETLGGTDALSTAESAAKTGEELSEAFKGLSEIVGREKAAVDSVKASRSRVDQAYVDSGYKQYGDPVSQWESFRKETLSARESVLSLPGAEEDDVIRQWGLGLDELANLPEGYRTVDIEAETKAVQGLLRTLAKDFTDCVAAVDAAQPPFEKINAASINVSGSFPSKLVVGRVAAFESGNESILKNLAIPDSMPFCDNVQKAAPVAYKDASLPQLFALRMAQALPQGLFEVFAIDSDNVGQTFREIAGLRKSGILTVSSKTTDDERILSELDAWLGDLSDRGCWDDSSDWADYNRKHPESPLPFKLVLFPSFASLDAIRLAMVVKLAKNGPASGVLPVFSEAALQSLDDREGEPAARTLSEIEFDWMDNEAEILYPLPPADVRQRVFDAIAQARENAANRKPAEAPLGMEALFAGISLWSGDATDGFSFPIGVQEDGSPLLMQIGDANVHGLIGGMTGSGKSNLLHAIIHSLCWKYSPAELELHLLDYKDGMEFKVYSNEDESQVWMPHAKTISTHNDPAYALSLFDELQREAMRRKKLFGAARSYREFRQKGGKLPRVFVLVDEFHKLFEGHEANAVSERIMQILKQGRSYGIHLLMSTQALRGIDADLTAMKGQISARLALRGNEDDGILDVDNDAAAHIERPMCIYNDRTGQKSGNHLFKVPFVDVVSSAEKDYREAIETATRKNKLPCKGRVFRGTELPRRPADVNLLSNAPATSGLAVRIGVRDDYLAQPAFVVLDDAPNGHFLAGAPNGDDPLDDAGNLTCNDVWNGLVGSVLASLSATPDTMVLLYNPLSRTAPAHMPDGWVFLGLDTEDEELREAMQVLAKAEAKHRVFVVENWAKALKLHPRAESGGSYNVLDETAGETARDVFASAFSPTNDTLPFHLMLFARNFSYACRETFGGYGSCDILKSCSQRVGVNLSESDLGQLFPTMPAQGSAHRILVGSTDSDEVVRFLPFRADA